MSWPGAWASAQEDAEPSAPPASLRLAPANQPTLDLEISGPPRAAVGGQATFALKITNNSASRFDRLLIVNDFDAGLRHEAGESPLEYELGTLGPGATKTVEITFDVKAGGKLSQQVEVTRSDKVLASGRFAVDCRAADAASTAPVEPAAKATGPAAAPREAGASPPKASIRSVTPRDTKTPTRPEVRPAPKRGDLDTPGIGPVDVEEPGASANGDASRPAASGASKRTTSPTASKRVPAASGDTESPRLKLIPEVEKLLTPGSYAPAASGKSSGKTQSKASGKPRDSGVEPPAADAPADDATPSADKPSAPRFSLPPRPSKLQPVPKKGDGPPQGDEKGSSDPDPAPRESKSSSLPGVERPYFMLREPVLSMTPADLTKPDGWSVDLSWTVAAADSPVERETPIDYGPPLVDDPSSLRKLDAEQPIWIDKKARKFVVVQGQVCNRSCPLELFACVRGSKEHESIVSTPVRPSLCHAALLAVGAESGAPARFQPRYEPARGDEIEIAVVWRDAQNRRRTAKAQDWVLDVKKKQPMTHPWVFAGSRFFRDPDTQRNHYLADGEGSLICVSNFTTALLDLPVESTAVNDELLFQAYTERIPPVGTPVTLVLTVKKAASKPAVAEPARADAPPKEPGLKTSSPKHSTDPAH